jgi:hypothetical protein
MGDLATLGLGSAPHFRGNQMNDCRNLLASILFVSIAATAQASITISNSPIYAVAETGGASAGNFFNGTTIPTSTTLDAIVGNVYSKNTIDWSVNGAQTILSFDMDHMRVGAAGSYAQTYGSWLTFTANNNEPYELSGYYNVTDVGTSGYVSLFTHLHDVTANADLFFNQQYSLNTINEQFVVDDTDGDNYNSLIGSPTGNLIAGHDYELYFEGLVYAYPDADAGASALGNFTLTIGIANDTVPEPLSLLVWSGLFLGAVAARARVR